MPTKKNKRKTVHQSNNKGAKHNAKNASVIRKHPRTFFYLGVALSVIGIFLLITGAHNNAKIGLAMLSIFIGGATVILAKFAQPKKTRESLKG